MSNHTVSERLKQIMKERGLRQVDILNKSMPFQKEMNVSMTKGYLSRYVNGKSTPHLNQVHLIAKTLNVNPAWLMGYDVGMEIQEEIQIPSKDAIEREIPDFITEIEPKHIREKIISMFTSSSDKELVESIEKILEDNGYAITKRVMAKDTNLNNEHPVTQQENFQKLRPELQEFVLLATELSSEEIQSLIGVAKQLLQAKKEASEKK